MKELTKWKIKWHFWVFVFRCEAFCRAVAKVCKTIAGWFKKDE